MFNASRIIRNGIILAAKELNIKKMQEGCGKVGKLDGFIFITPDFSQCIEINIGK
jgi:hypothetical protein